MPFNPNLPIDDTICDAAQMRGQLNGLNDKINNIPAGPPGAEGPMGPEGPQGPPFAQAVVDGVQTLPPGSAATVSVSFDGHYVHFDFGIPQGETGASGEVTQGQLDAAIATTAQNPSGIGPYTGSFSDPPTQGEMQDFAAYVETLRVGLVR